MCLRTAAISGARFIVARAKAGAIRRLVTSIVLISVSMLLATGIVLAVPADEWAPPVRTGVWDAVVLQMVRGEKLL